MPQAYALSSPSVILDVLNPKMFVKTCVFRHSFSCHFFFCVVFKEHFASVFFPNRFAVPRKVRPRSLTTRSSLFFVTSRPSEKILCKTRRGVYIPFGLRYTLKTNQCRTAFAARCLDSEICSEVSLASCLLRKEVIQPHLPIRLPCYDFTPVIAPTFDGFHRLRV